MNIKETEDHLNERTYPCSGCSMRSLHPACKETCIFSSTNSYHI